MANLPVPVPRTYTVGETETGSYFNATRDGLNFLLGLPIATVYQTAGQTLATANTALPVSFDSTVVDSYGGHSNTVNNSRYTAQVAGWYAIGGSVVFTGGQAGTYRKVQVYQDGNPVPYAAAQVAMVNSAFATTVPISPTIIFMNVGDFVSLYASVDLANASTFANAQNQSYMTVFWVHN